MKVSVTQDDIDHGERHCCERCPVARAIRRVIGDMPVVEVERDNVTIGPLGGWTYATLPTRATKFIDRFDVGLKVAPFTFELKYELEIDLTHV